MKLTVYFEGQFWVGVLEEVEDGRVRACRYVFGSEPKETEVLDFVKHRAMSLLEQSTQTAEGSVEPKRKHNPKRMARLAAKETQQRGISTYAQEALQLELEKRKRTRKMQAREQREAEKERKYALKVTKAKQKHRGK
ncbi:YjdF family protein [Aneurinibacillus sp. BA2021]|nr:YjdF family protein [Aneurinibacillus sp. BA2021]